MSSSLSLLSETISLSLASLSPYKGTVSRVAVLKIAFFYMGLKFLFTGHI